MRRMRAEVGLREVAVVVGLLLGAPRRQRARARVEVERLLPQLLPALPDRDLPLDLGLDAPGDVVEGVHVLELAARAQLARAGRADRDVGVDAQRALLHLGVRDAELDDRLPQELEHALRLLGGVDVRRGHDLDERRAAAVEVDERVRRPADAPAAAADVERLGRVLLEVRTHDPDHMLLLANRYEHLAIYARRHIVLGDLIALWQVGVEVVLAGEDGTGRDLAAEREPELQRPFDRLPVRHGEGAREAEADRAGLGVLGRAEPGRAAAEHLRARLELDVDLEADDGLPGHDRHLRGTVSKPIAASSA
jgi:hypothetical protein